MKKNAVLFIIDMQNDFLKNKKSPVYIPGSDKIIKPIKKVKQFFLNQNQKIINIVTVHSENKKQWGKKDIELNRKYCIENTEGAEIIDELKPVNETEIIVKKRLYSAFFETDLKNILTQLKITDIYFTGLTTGCCVSSTARDAYNYNYDLFFVKECLTASDKQAHNYELKFFQKSLGKVIKSKNIKF